MLFFFSILRLGSFSHGFPSLYVSVVYILNYVVSLLFSFCWSSWAHGLWKHSFKILHSLSKGSYRPMNSVDFFAFLNRYISIFISKLFRVIRRNSEVIVCHSWILHKMESLISVILLVLWVNLTAFPSFMHFLGKGNIFIIIQMLAKLEIIVVSGLDAIPSIPWGSTSSVSFKDAHKRG